MLGTEPRASWALDRRSTNGATPLSLGSFLTETNTLLLCNCGWELRSPVLGERVFPQLSTQVQPSAQHPWCLSLLREAALLKSPGELMPPTLPSCVVSWWAPAAPAGQAQELSARAAGRMHVSSCSQLRAPQQGLAPLTHLNK